MRLICFYCGKSVSTELPAETVVRAICVCPECIEEGRDVDDGKPCYVADALMAKEEIDAEG